MIIYHSRFLTRGEVWFDNNPSPARVDWIIYHQRSKPISQGNWRPFYTQLIDLTQPADGLLARMDGFTAADIRKAQKKDRTLCRLLDVRDRGTFAHFADFYDRFAALKRLGPADRPWLERTAEAGKLDLWCADGPEGQRQAYHVFYRDPHRVRSVHMASLYAEALTKEDQRRIGRANRLLVWTCMLHYQTEGVQVFDLGGWYNGKTDPALLGINKFKEAFGGKTVCEYQGEHLLTLKAWGAVNLARLFQKVKDRTAPRAISSTSERAASPVLGAGQALGN